MKQKINIFVIGLVMGAAEIVPGVSGGTIAFITGIYERLLSSLKHFTPGLLLLLKDEGFMAVWRRVDAEFLLLLFGGMGTSILLLATGISYLLVHEPILLWSFFFGLVLASSWLMSRQIDRLNLNRVAWALAGIGIGVVITGLAPIELAPTPMFIFIGGAVAVCAWILPGISGSFILLILGLYGFVIEAIRQLDIATLVVLAAGCSLGLISFAQVLSRLFKNRRNETLAMLTGFMLGSLVKLWPWKQTLAYQIGSDGHQIPLVQEAVLPSTYVLITGHESQIGLALLALLVGLAAVVLLGKLAYTGNR
jgi:putative membrane protein